MRWRREIMGQDGRLLELDVSLSILWPCGAGQIPRRDDPRSHPHRKDFSQILHHAALVFLLAACWQVVRSIVEVFHNLVKSRDFLRLWYSPSHSQLIFWGGTQLILAGGQPTTGMTI